MDYMAVIEGRSDECNLLTGRRFSADTSEEAAELAAAEHFRLWVWEDASYVFPMILQMLDMRDHATQG